MKIAEYKWRIGKKIKINHPSRVYSGEYGAIEDDWGGRSSKGNLPI